MMKNFRFFMILCLVFSALTLNAKSPKNKNANVAEVTYSVNLHCHSCVEKINANLPYIKGVKDLNVNLDEHTVWVKFNKSKTSVDLIARELVKMGYSVKVLATKNVPGFDSKENCCNKGQQCGDDDDDDDCCKKDKDND